MLRRTLPLATVAAASLALAPAAGAHNVSLSPNAGDLNTVFQFRGTAWQPFSRVTVEYFTSTRSTAPFRSFRLFTRGNGSFGLNWTDSLLGLTHRMCFRQVDTRFGRTFRKCTLFWVGLPYAQWMLTFGNPGDTFVLFVSGFPPGRTLTVTTTPPPGIPAGGPFTVRTRTSGAFVINIPCTASGPAFGPIFVPRGGAACGFTGGSAGPGLYTSLVRDPVSRLEAYATARLLR
jgi:hypothetical protein